MTRVDSVDIHPNHKDRLVTLGREAGNHVLYAVVRCVRPTVRRCNRKSSDKICTSKCNSPCCVHLSIQWRGKWFDSIQSRLACSWRRRIGARYNQANISVRAVSKNLVIILESDLIALSEKKRTFWRQSEDEFEAAPAVDNCNSEYPTM